MTDLNTRAAEMRMFGCVSNIYTGMSLFSCETAEQAEEECYRDVLAEKECDDDYDPENYPVLPEQFRAWPYFDWPHDLSFADAFDWIGEQNRAAVAALEKNN
jgi:hypothetical protein